MLKTGDSVWKGKTLGIMEAMKMEHEIISSVSGTVEEINVSISIQFLKDTH